MADFLANQQTILSARRALDAAEIDSVTAAARAQQARDALDRGVRLQSDQDAHRKVDIEQLEAAAQQAAEQRDVARRRLADARASLGAAGAQFAEFSDPRRNIGRLSDTAPFLLFPVRIETRFKTITAPQRPGVVVLPPRHQLWVRIFPDDCSVDTFEPTMSRGELANVKNYWMNVWRAGGVENDERGAWRNLVAAHGSGRAGWLVDNYRPTAAAPRPVKVSTTEVILVAPATVLPIAADASALASYWR